MITTACLDWEQRLRAGQSLIPANLFEINPDECKRAIGIFNKLRLADVIGMPKLGDAAGEWFREIVGVLLGSIDPVTRARVVREVFCLVPKKNAKTSYGAGLMLTALLLNERPRAEFLFVGPTQAVADIAFEQAAGMVENDDVGFLQKRMHVQAHLKTIRDRKTKAELKIKSFDASVITGVKPAGVLIDELHEISKSARAGKIIGQLRGGLVANPEAFLFFITTQSDDPPAGAFKAELAVARAIRDGKTVGAMLPVLYEFPADFLKRNAWRDPSNWSMVLPNLGRSIQLERLEEECKTAQEKGEEEFRRWCSQHLNIEIGIALLADRWPGADFWDRQTEPALTLEEILKRSEVVVIGIDGGGLDDLFGLCVLGRCRETKDWLAWSKAWCHKGVLERRKSIAARLTDFQTADELVIVDDELDDISQIIDVVRQVKDSGLLSSVAVDPACIGEFVDALAGIDITPENKRVLGVPQGWNLMTAIKTAERKLANGTLWHSENACMSWCVGNLKIEPTATGIRATKQHAGDAKVDPAIALFNAAWFMQTNPAPAGSVYEERGLIFF